MRPRSKHRKPKDEHEVDRRIAEALGVDPATITAALDDVPADADADAVGYIALATGRQPDEVLDAIDQVASDDDQEAQAPPAEEPSAFEDVDDADLVVVVGELKADYYAALSERQRRLGQNTRSRSRSYSAPSASTGKQAPPKLTRTKTAGKAAKKRTILTPKSKRRR